MSRLTTVNFKNDTLFAIESEEGIHVAIKPICDSLGIEWRKQRERIQRDPILSEGSTMMGLPSPGGQQETVVLRLDLVSGWLMGIDESRVKDEETRQRVLAYKRECHAVLYGHFFKRSTGAEILPPAPRMDEPVNVRRQLVAEARQTFGVQASRQLWLKLGLPTVPAMFSGFEQQEFPFTYTAVQSR